MFKFLKLHSSSSGDARRHVPFASIIHNTFRLIICLIISFSFIIPTSVKAEAFPIPPVWLPINPYNTEGLAPNFELLSDDQKKIVHEIIGAYNTTFLGFGFFPLVNPLTSKQGVRGWWQDYGSKFVNDFLSSPIDTSYSPAISNLIGSATYKASQYNSYSDYADETDPDVPSGSQKYFVVPPELQVAFKNWYAANGGIEDWQISVKPFKSNDTWNVSNLNSVQLNNLNNAYNSYTGKQVRFNYTYSPQWTNAKMISTIFDSYTNMFIDTTNNVIKLCDNSGNALPSANYVRWVLWDNNVASSQSTYSFGTLNYNSANYNSYVEIARAAYNHDLSGSQALFYEDFVQHVYVGANWASRDEIYNIDDLDVGLPSSNYIDATNEDAFVDINSLLGRIADNVTDLRQAVEDSTLVRDRDQAIPYADAITTAIDKYMTEPTSQVFLPVGLFNPFSDYIGYLWYMTKPLVSFTGDLVDLLIFDPVAGFNGSGPGYIFLGVVCCGLIGGLIVKCLL